MLDTNNPRYVARMRELLQEHYYTDTGLDYLETELGKSDFAAHVGSRYHNAADHVVPWLASRFDLSRMSAIEVGSGTGSSTLALAEKMKFVDCYELHNPSKAVATGRLDFWGINNYRIHSTLFDDQCEFVRSGQTADAIMLYATLEHMTPAECLAVLSLSWRVLAVRGILIVAETPNRLCVHDHHTSWLPFFCQLPREIQVLYASRSPRADFRKAIERASAVSPTAALEMMQRWGSGISYHEFELAIGDVVHSSIVLDGYEPQITRIFPAGKADSDLQELFREFKIPAHRAFTRNSMFFVIQKQ